MILHCVFCNFRADVSVEQRQKTFEELSAFSLSLDGVLAFDFGPNRDYEKKSQDYSDGFVVRFASQSALELYADHQMHKELGKHLCDLCEGGGEGIIVFDIETP
ncbi:Dabb family protein [Aliiroseovarius sp. M344]|nr:Dabb family protein [Aliiroseovarius sp. M344]